MTLLFRLIKDDKPWTAYESLNDGAEKPAAPPLWAVREFMPTHRDNAGLSFYEVDSEDHGSIVAGAFAFSYEDIAKGKTIFAYTDRENLEKNGFEILQTPGNTGNSVVDALHREIKLINLDQVGLLTKLFLGGDFASYEGKVSAGAAKKSARANHFSFEKVGAVSFNGNWRGKNFLKFVSDGDVRAFGCDVCSPRAPSQATDASAPIPET